MMLLQNFATAFATEFGITAVSTTATYTAGTGSNANTYNKLSLTVALTLTFNPNIAPDS